MLAEIFLSILFSIFYYAIIYEIGAKMGMDITVIISAATGVLCSGISAFVVLRKFGISEKLKGLSEKLGDTSNNGNITSQIGNTADFGSITSQLGDTKTYGSVTNQISSLNVSITNQTTSIHGEVTRNKETLIKLECMLQNEKDERSKIESQIDNRMTESIQQGMIAFGKALKDLADSRYENDRLRNELGDLKGNLKQLTEEMNQLKEENQKLKQENVLLRELASKERESFSYGKEQSKDDFELEL